MDIQNNILFDFHKASRRFIEIRTKNNLTQDEMASALGVALQTVKNYEKAGSSNARDSSEKRTNAIAGMKIETLYTMARKFNVSTDYILGLSDIESIDPNVRAVMDYTGLSEDSIIALYAWSHINEVIDDDVDSIPAPASSAIKQARLVRNPNQAKDLFLDLMNTLIAQISKDAISAGHRYMRFMLSLIEHYKITDDPSRQYEGPTNEEYSDLMSRGFQVIGCKDAAEWHLTQLFDQIKSRFRFVCHEYAEDYAKKQNSTLQQDESV